MDSRECSDLTQGLWDKLEENLQLEIFARLPVKNVYKFRRVCKEWKVLLSNKFISDIWAKTPLNKEPWLIVCDIFSNTPCMVYCFYTKTWKSSFSISRAPTIFEVLQRGSTAGLLLLDKLPSEGCCPSYVYNPYSWACIKLPCMLFIRNILGAKGIVQSGSDCINKQENCYKVVAVGLLHGGLGSSVVEIYESCTKSWRIAEHLPREFVVKHDLVFLDGTCYCLVMQYTEQAMGIFGFSLSASAGQPLSFVQLPKLLSNSRTTRLILCGPRILVAASVAVEDVVQGQDARRTITIWELEKHDRLGSSSWKEITRMPPSLYEEDSTAPLVWFECVGVGETWACFKSVVGNPTTGLVFAYNTSNNSWTRLPPCPTLQWNRQSLLAFQPRPDMTVE